MANKLNRRAVAVVALSFLAGLALTLIFAEILGYSVALNRSESFPETLFIVKDGKPDALKRGDLILFEVSLPNTRYEAELHGKKLLKSVACNEGDRLERVENRFICNGKEVAVVQSADSNGKAHELSFDFNGVIPQGRLFAVAPHKYSFDSRYFGLIDKNAIEGTVKCVIF